MQSKTLTADNFNILPSEDMSLEDLQVSEDMLLNSLIVFDFSSEEAKTILVDCGDDISIDDL